MSDLRRMARGFGLSLVLAYAGLVFGLSGVAGRGSTGRYLPDGPNVPIITLNESQEGAAGLPPLPVPPPNGWNQQSIWNMKVVGFNDNQGRPSSDDGWIENQNGRYILYMTDSGGSALQPTDETSGAERHVADRRHPSQQPGLPVAHPGVARAARRMWPCAAATL